jgi:DNA topoisomerase VI subunit B
MVAKLHRTTLRTSRLLDFASEKELVTQTGHAKSDWPLVVLKELIDNALDACEDAGCEPKITIKAKDGAVTVSDNGPGIPADVVAGVLDFGVRVSDKEAYVSPTRGAQGNALKTILAMPFVLDGRQGRVTITARGIRHDIGLRVDAIRQEPIIDHRTHKALVKNGTSVKVCWPNSACSILHGARERFLQIAGDYTVLNPHLTLTVDWFGKRTTTKPTSRTWRKWRPSDPTDPHWYALEAFERLLCGYLTHDQDRMVREVVAEFSGLTSTAKQKAVLNKTGLSRLSLAALRDGDGLDHKRTAALLKAMKSQTRPVKPRSLGIIGKTHFEKRLNALGCEMQTFVYRKQLDFADGVPWVMEVAFAWRPDADARRLVTGVNWSPCIVNPFRELGTLGSLDSVMQEQRAGKDEAVVLALHLVCPRVQYTDRGKSAVVIRENS